MKMDTEESLLKFPCDFPIKAMGKAEDDFDALIVGLIRKHCTDLQEGSVKSRQSNGGRFVSVTVTIQAQSREQLDNIYMELTAEERVLMAL
jgi:putative lipoic acid-binding regulatory protein